MFIMHFLQKKQKKNFIVQWRQNKENRSKRSRLLTVPSMQGGKYVSALSYKALPLLNQNLQVFKKHLVFKKNYPKPTFYKNASRLPVTSSLNSLIFLNCNRKFVFLLSRLFWNLKVTDHKFILLWLRRVCKYIYSHKKQFSVKGLSILVKGKLGVTGNKRTRTFKVNYGPNSSTKIISNTCSNYFTIRTTTGVIGLTTSITYNH